MNRNSQWLAFYREQMQNVPVDDENGADDATLASAESTAWNYARGGRYADAANAIARTIDRVNSLSDADKGWYLQLEASYLNHIDKPESQLKQLKAHELNRNVLKPLEGTRYRRIQAKNSNQASAVLAWMKTYNDPNALVAAADTILSDLCFGISFDIFEDALTELAHILGMTGQRVDKEGSGGPDVLWRMTNGHYVIFEAKNQKNLSGR